MIAVLSLLLVATLFITAARVATIALIGTGMANDVAAFQVRSALMGVGYTTSEAEHVINHPVRRRVILWLMIFGNAGVITGITSLLLGFVDAEADQTVRRGLVLALGLVVLLILTRLHFLERILGRMTRWALSTWTSLETRDLASLLRFSEEYGIIELHARAGDWLVGRPLARLHLPDEGVVILGLQQQNGRFQGAPTGQSVIGAEDTVIAYGRLDHLQELDDRHKGRAGDLAHLEAVREQHELIESADDVARYQQPKPGPDAVGPGG
ncbi:MAG: TrkA C-terminal domain-containing protein [Acidimicrobiia bacterium]|nr:TrkA C-terminal domain-containing protein [Acidimicrobiia bacterium]RZV42046.1 MAG: potassium transporter TrkA [Acidimicrobiales bacterium]